MDNEELKKLKEKADSGDAEACFEYAIKIHDRYLGTDEVNKKPVENDYRECWIYLLKILEHKGRKNIELIKEIKPLLYPLYYDFYSSNLIDRLSDDKEFELKIWYWKYNEVDFVKTNDLIRSTLKYALVHVNDQLKGDNLNFVKWAFKSKTTDNTEKAVASYVLAKSVKNTNPKKYFSYMEFCSKYRLNGYHDEILFEVGKCYLDGYGVKQDYEKARQYLECSQISDAYCLLGKIYEDGLGCERDVSKAYSYYDKGYTAACHFGKARIIYNNEIKYKWDISNAIHDYKMAENTISEAVKVLKYIEKLENKEKANPLKLSNVKNPQLDTVLQNEIDNIINKIEALLKRKTDSIIVKKIKKIKIVYSYEEKKEESYFDISEVIKEIESLIIDLKDLMEKLELKDNYTSPFAQSW